MTKILTLSLLALSLAFGGEADTKLPASAQQVLDKAEAAVAANRAAYDKANAKPLADADKALKAEMEKATKAGKLNEALAIQKVLEGLRESVVACVDEKAKAKGDLLGDTADPKDVVLGKWKRGAGTVEFKKNGTFTDSRNVSGTWNLNKDGSFTMTWGDSGMIVNCSKPVKNVTVENGGPGQLTKIVE